MSKELKYQPNQKVYYNGFEGVILSVVNSKKKIYTVDFGRYVVQIQEDQLTKKD